MASGWKTPSSSTTEMLAWKYLRFGLFSFNCYLYILLGSADPVQIRTSQPNEHFVPLPSFFSSLSSFVVFLHFVQNLHIFQLGHCPSTICTEQLDGHAQRNSLSSGTSRRLGRVGNGGTAPGRKLANCWQLIRLKMFKWQFYKKIYIRNKQNLILKDFIPNSQFDHLFDQSKGQFSLLLLGHICTMFSQLDLAMSVKLSDLVAGAWFSKCAWKFKISKSILCNNYLHWSQEGQPGGVLPRVWGSPARRELRTRSIPQITHGLTWAFPRPSHCHSEKWSKVHWSAVWDSLNQWTNCLISGILGPNSNPMLARNSRCSSA